ncbi:MAG TPA: DUF4382 domain-containing protein [Longimicrobiaceae bacterium]|nr:DUF4382 domain-containing protein [Longimicrobiaceae bacterium]
MLVDRRTLFLPLAVCSLALAACDGSTNTESASLTIRLTDAPGDLEEAWVKIERIYLQGTSTADSLSGRQDLLTTPTGYVDLLTLADQTVQLVGGATVPAGTYSQLRFVVCDAWVRTAAGDVYATQSAELPAGVTADGQLRIPSGCQSGIKVKLPGGGLRLEEGASIMVVDFDVSQSFGHQAGNSGAWVMHPVLLATEVAVGGGISGRVSVAQGVTLPSCGGSPVAVTHFVPRATAGDATVSGTVKADSSYGISPVAPGTYTLGYAAALSFTNGDSLTFAATPAPASVTVASGGTATADYSITAATCKAAP